MRRFILILLLLASASAARAVGVGVLREAAGLVQVRPDGSDRWKPAGLLPRTMSPGDSLRTGFNARAVLTFEGGERLEAGGNTQVSLDEAARDGVAANLIFGTVRMSARFLGGRLMELRTPTAVARARSEASAWTATVGDGGTTVLQAEVGLIAVEDARGGALRLREGERVETDLAGLHEPTSTPTPARARRDDFAERMRRELALDQEIDAAQRLVSNEMLQEQYELGQVQTNASGDMVRVEEYVVRLSPTSFEFVALNDRRGSGLSWYSWTGVFNASLPMNLSPVFNILPGSVGAPAPWTLTGYTSVSSNGIDSLVGSATGGHQVNLNGNSYPSDAVAQLYNPTTDLYQNVTGQAVYKVLFDGFGLYSDGVLKNGWTGVNIQSPSQEIPFNAPTTNRTFPDPGSVRQTVLNSYSDGSEVTVDNRAVSVGGGVVSRAAFGDATSGPAWDSGLLRSAFEQTTAATEFGGRSIDVMVSPRVLVETGGLP